MKVTHFHLGVIDFDQAIHWFETIMLLKPKTGKDFAVFDLGNIKVVLDKAEKDSAIIIGIESKCCDADFEQLLKRGATGVQEPKDYPSTGSRAAIIQGPGAIKIELDQSLI